MLLFEFEFSLKKIFTSVWTYAAIGVAIASVIPINPELQKSFMEQIAKLPALSFLSIALELLSPVIVFTFIQIMSSKRLNKLNSQPIGGILGSHLVLVILPGICVIYNLFALSMTASVYLFIWAVSRSSMYMIEFVSAVLAIRLWITVKRYVFRLGRALNIRRIRAQT